MPEQRPESIQVIRKARQTRLTWVYITQGDHGGGRAWTGNGEAVLAFVAQGMKASPFRSRIQLLGQFPTYQALENWQENGAMILGRLWRKSVVGGLSGSFRFCDSPRHGCLATAGSTNSNKGGGLPLCLHFTPPEHPFGNSSDFIFLRGPFGGYGAYAAQRAGVHSYEIRASATEIRMIVYASGCEIQTFVIPLAEDSRVKQQFPCKRVTTVKLSGQIVPNELVRNNNAELLVMYMAYWAHGFYGIADGAVTELRLATVSPDGDGMFQVDLPYFSADAAAASSQGRAGLWLMLRDSKTWNHIASDLEPVVPELRLEGHGLRIRSHYPDGLKFTRGPF